MASFEEIATKLKREAGVTSHAIRRGLSGRAIIATGAIVAPAGTTRDQLYILAHECGHIALKHGHKPSHRREYEAERYAHDALRRHGIPVSKKMTARAKAYVRRKIAMAVKAGAKRIDPEAKAWAAA